MQTQKTAKSFAQQGDCILHKINKVPIGDQKTLFKKKCILAYGEHSGHSHVIEDDEAELIQIGEQILLKLEKQATLKHEEHLPITLEPGIWEVGQVIEKDWLNNMVASVRD